MRIPSARKLNTVEIFLNDVSHKVFEQMCVKVVTLDFTALQGNDAASKSYPRCKGLCAGIHLIFWCDPGDSVIN